MMTEMEQQKLRELNDLHLKGTRAQKQEAATSAYERSMESGLDSRVQAERATQALVFSTARVQDEHGIETAYPYLLRIADVIMQSYPVGVTAEEAQEHKAMWEQAFDGRSGYIIALRDMYRSYQMLGIITKDPGIIALAGKIYTIVEKFALEHPEDRDALQFFIQLGTYADGVRALATYKEKYAENNQIEYIQFVAEIFGKSLAEMTKESLQMAGVLFAELLSLAQADLAGTGKFVITQLASKAGKHVLKAQQRHYKHLAQELSKTEEGTLDLSKLSVLGDLVLAS